MGVLDVLMMAAKTRLEGMRVPENLRQAMESTRGAQWLKALKREYGGIVSRGVFDEVDRSAWTGRRSCRRGCPSRSKRRDLRGALPYDEGGAC